MNWSSLALLFVGVFLACVAAVVLGPRCRAWQRRRREAAKIEAQLERLWRHRDSLSSHVSWAKERRDLADARNLAVELRRVDDDIRALNAKFDQLGAGTAQPLPRSDSVVEL